MDKLDPKYEALFTPWRIGNVEIKNRIVLCPMGGGRQRSLRQVPKLHGLL